MIYQTKEIFKMSGWKILLTDGLEDNGQAILRGSAEVVDQPTITADELLKTAGGYDALIVRGRERDIHRFSCQVHPGNSAIERALESCGLDPERRTIWSLNL